MNDNDTSTIEQPTTPTPVSFSPEQQARIDTIVKSAMGRSASETKAELAQERQRAAELEARLQETESKAAIAAAERDAERIARKDAEHREITSRRAALISQACVDYDLIDADIVAALVEDNFRWNDSQKSFDIIVDGSSEQVDADDDEEAETSQPMTTSEFFAHFATQKPYLVRSNVHSGAGSGDSSRTGLPTGRLEYKVEDIFGRNSSSQLANRLAQKDPAAYRRLKAEARNKKLI